MVTPRDGILTVLVRSASQDRLNFLDQALFSLATQHWQDIEVLLMLQSPSAEFLAAATAVLNAQPWSPGSTSRAVPVVVASGSDGRAQLLNAGIAEASGRYLAFLDDDDVVYARGYTALIGALQRTHASIAIGDCRLSYVVEIDGVIHFTKKADRFFRAHNQSKFDLFVENFIPIHSYVVDRMRAKPESLVFRSDAIPLEDYDFLLRLSDGNEFDLSCADIPVCEYRMHDGNTIWGNSATKDNSTGLQRARGFINDQKQAITMSVRLRELEEIRSRFAGGFPGYPNPQETPFLVSASIRLDNWIKRKPSRYALASRVLRIFRGPKQGGQS